MTLITQIKFNTESKRQRFGMKVAKVASFRQKKPLINGRQKNILLFMCELHSLAGLAPTKCKRNVSLEQG